MRDLPTPPPPPRPRAFQIYKGRHLVLTLEDRPGVLLSTASPPPSGAPTHPFVNARAYDPYSEDELGTLLRRAVSFDDFLRSLIDAGYNAIASTGSPPAELGRGERIEDRQGPVGVAWDAPGVFTRLWGPLDEHPSSFNHATVTVYRDDQADALLRLVRDTDSYVALRHELETHGYRLSPVGEYTV